MATVELAKVAIVGGGIGGLTLAHALTAFESKVRELHIFERSGRFLPTAGAGLSLNGAGVLLAQLGLGKPLSKILTPLEKVEVSNDSGRRLVSIDVLSIIRSNKKALLFDGKPYMGQVLRADLHRLLAEALPASVQVHYNSEVTNVAPQLNGRLRLDLNGAVQSHRLFDLVVGADGIRSVARKLVDQKSTTRYTGLQVIFGLTEGCQRAQPRLIHAVVGKTGAASVDLTAGGCAPRDMVAVVQRCEAQLPDLWKSGEAQEEGVKVVADTQGVALQAAPAAPAWRL